MYSSLDTLLCWKATTTAVFCYVLLSILQLCILNLESKTPDPSLIISSFYSCKIKLLTSFYNCISIITKSSRDPHSEKIFQAPPAIVFLVRRNFYYVNFLLFLILQLFQLVLKIEKSKNLVYNIYIRLREKRTITTPLYLLGFLFVHS